MMGFVSGDGLSKATASAGTRIRLPAGGKAGGLYSHIVNLRYTDTGTAHTLTMMRGASRAKVVGALAAAATSVVVDAALTDGDGNALAASDVVALPMDNGEWHVSAVSAWNATTKTITLTTAIPSGRSVADGARIVSYGAPGDTYHARYQFTGGAGSAAVNFPAVSGSVMSLCKAPALNEPIILDSNNATNAGTVEYVNIGYSLF
jgi:hypothetical protein